MRMAQSQFAQAEKRAEEAEFREQEAVNRHRVLENNSRLEINRFKEEAEMATNAARIATREAGVATENARNMEAWALSHEDRALQAQARLQKVEEDAASEYDNLQKQNQALASRLDQSEANVRQLLDQLTQGKVDGKWDPPPDEEIRDSTHALHNRVKAWAKKWTNTALKLSQLDPDIEQKFVRYLGKFVQLTPDGSLPPMIVKPSTRMADKVPALLLNAALAHEIHKAFFENSFFVRSKHAKALDEIFDDVVDG